MNAYNIQNCHPLTLFHSNMFSCLQHAFLNRNYCGLALYNSFKRTKVVKKKETVDHFKRGSVLKTIIYPTLTAMAVIRKKGDDTSTKITDKKTLRLPRTMFNNKDPMSQREVASKFNCSKSYIGKTL